MPDPQILPEQVFKFVSYRPPERAQLSTVRTQFMWDSDGRPTDFRQALAELDGTEAASRQSVTVSRAFIASGAYVANPVNAQRDLLPYAGLAQVIAAAADAEEPETEVLTALERHLGTSVRSYIQNDDVRSREDRLWDSLYAVSIARQVRVHDRDEIVRALRIQHLLHAIADLPADADRLPGSLEQYLTATPLFPTHLLPRSAEVPPSTPPEGPTSPRAELVRHLQRTQQAIREMRTEIDNHQARLLRERGDLNAAPPANNLALPRQSNWSWLLGSRPPPVAPKPSSSRWSFTRLPPESVGALSQETRRLVGDIGFSFELATAPEIIEGLEASTRQAVSRYVASTPRRHAYRLGSGYLQPGLEQPLGPAGVVPPASGAAPEGRIRNKGIADLLIVQQTLLRYEPGEVAHIENVMRAESRKRSHRRLSRNETEIIQETESTKDSERDLQTTERFEMQRETETTQKLDASVKAGVSVTASYGPVETTVYADFALQYSRSESARTATNYARDVSERSVARIMEREREQRTRRTIEEFEEINRHGFENIAADSQHISGIYRWVDKVYEAQIINYGRRLMLEFILPEPAAFYRHAERYRSVEGVSLDPPEPPMVVEDIPGVGPTPRELQSPAQLTRSNYIWPVGQYNVAGVALPPADQTIVAAALEQAAATTPAVSKASTELKMPPGYVAATAEFHGWHYSTSGASVYTQIGNFFTYNSDGLTGLNWEDQLVPFSVLAEATPWIMNVEIVCRLTPEAFAAWQVDTFNAIMTAYRERESAYREQLAAALIRQGVAIVGRNPARNREIEREEIKKACIRIMSGTDFSEFNAMHPAGGRADYPEFDVAESMTEGRQIQFFEQAFEWDQLTYLFYPYFWSNRPGWLDVHQLDDVDPLFSRFLQAGAARVLVPVRPPFNDAVLNYLSTEQPPADPWNGGSAPIINDPLYISLAAELREANGGRTAGEPVDEPWQIKVPTSLVILQADAVLPNYTAPNP